MAINLNQNNPNNPQGQQNGPQAAGAQPQQQQKPQGTGFTNLKSVLNANQNNKLGQAVSSGVQNVTNKTQGQTQEAQNKFNQQLGQSVQDIQKGQQVQQKLSNLDFSKDAGQAATDVNSLNTDEYANTTKNLRAGYQGPQGLQSQDALQAQAQQLGQTAQGLLTQGGRQAALQRFIGAGPSYTQGKQSLDNMLLGQSSNNQAINDARRNAAIAAQGTNQAINQAAAQGQFTGQQFNTLNQDISSKLSNLGQNLGSTLDARAQAKVADAQKQVGDLQAALRNGTLSQEQYDMFSKNILGGSDQTYTLGNDPNQLANLVQANTNYNRSNVANQNEAQARDALARLSGDTDPNALLNLDKSQVGTAGEGLLKNQSAIDSYRNLMTEAENAKAGFNYETPVTNMAPISVGAAAPTGPFGSYNRDWSNPFASGQKLDFKQAGDIWAQLNDPTANRETIYNNLMDKGIFDQASAGDFLKSHYDTGKLNPIGQQYADITKKYGLGNSLKSLLAKK